MWLLHATLRSFFFTIVCTTLAIAQSSSPLPKLTPSYSEDFSDYKSYPSMCFENAFWDKNGKLWLSVCGSASQINLHVFQFDGYEFKLVQGELEKLDHNALISGLYQSRMLVGFIVGANKHKIFTFDPETDQLQLHDLPEEGEITKLVTRKDGRAFLILEKESQFSIYEFMDGQFILLKKLEAQYQWIQQWGQLASNVLYFDGEVMWISPPEIEFIERIEINSGRIQKIGIQNEEKSSRIKRAIKLNLFNGDAYMQYITADDKESLLQLKAGSNQFKPIKEIPAGSENSKVFQDEKGNLVFLFRGKGRKYTAILQDSNGKRYDYSAFFEKMEDFDVTNLISPDFKQQVFICHTAGFLLHKAKVSDAIQNFLPAVSVRAMAEFPDQKYYITAQNLHRFLIDGKTGEASPFEIPDCIPNPHKLFPDKENPENIWGISGTDIIKYNAISNTCKKYNTGTKNIRLIAFIDKEQLAILDFYESLGIYNLTSGTSTPFLLNGVPFKFSGYVHDLVYGQNDLLWAATTEGLNKIDLKAGVVEVIGKEAPFLDPRFLCIDEDENGKLWLGTPLGGLNIYDPVSKELKILNSDKGLGNNTVVSIIPDDEGIRWLGTYNGISMVSPDGELIANLYEEDGLAHRESNRYARFKASDGKIFIGTIHGLSIIDPKKIKENLAHTNDLKIYLTSLEYFDTKLGNNRLQRYGLCQPGKVTLPAAHRNLKLSFATSNYFKPNENKYAYMLEGMEEDWTDLGNQHTLNLTLPAGNHRLLIKGSDGAGNWTNEPIAVQIEAKEYFYKRVWFYLLCVLLLGSIVLLWITRLRTEIKRATRKIREDKELIEQQAEKLKELDIAKSQFFTNISHEFRTPLTIISGMIDQVAAKPDVWLVKGAKMIKQNALNLLHLINQILDLRKLESKSLSLNLVQGDIVKYLQYLTESYQSYAENKGLTLHFLASQPSVIMDYDPDKILRIISNPLSNAIKYNKEEGHIYFQIDKIIAHGSGWPAKGQECLQMRVQDTGAGIPKEKLPDIFGRFYQVKGAGERKVIGSGIGLALTHELVKLMNGEIEVTSEVGIGSTFLIKLPVTRSALVTDSFSQPSTPTAVIPPVIESEPVLSTSGREEGSSLPNLLIVEDNQDVMQTLIACLEEDYQLQMARNGQEGIDRAIEQVPDIIVSDVMMPIKDGFELCHTLKQDERTSHIPIILLTAKTDIDSRISGLEKGADAYLAKPFEQKELLVRLKKLLELRQKLQERYRSFEPDETPTSPEDIFIQKIRQAIEENIDDETFGITRLSRAIGLSRAQLHNKIKALTGLSTSIYIRSIRLKKAKHLLETTDLNVSEVAYEVGFKNPAYFSSTYQEEFGVSPSKTRK